MIHRITHEYSETRNTWHLNTKHVPCFGILDDSPILISSQGDGTHHFGKPRFLIFNILLKI